MIQANTYIYDKIATKHQVANLKPRRRRKWPFSLLFATSRLTNKNTQSFYYETESLT